MNLRETLREIINPTEKVKSTLSREYTITYADIKKAFNLKGEIITITELKDKIIVTTHEN